MMPLKILFVLVITAAASRRQSPTISTQCKKELKGIQTREREEAVAACENKANYTQQAIAHLQNGDKSAAESTIVESFQKCAKFSEKCAKEFAPGVIQQLEFSGDAVSNKCKQSILKVQNDDEKMKAVAMCDRQEKATEKVLVALTKDDLKSAVDAAHVGLVKCMGLSERCASQFAPFVVNQVVKRAMMEQHQNQTGPADIPTTTVFGHRATTDILSGLPNALEGLSLVGAALEGLLRVQPVFQKSSHLSFLQKNEKKRRLPKQFVSRLVLQLAR